MSVFFSANMSNPSGERAATTSFMTLTTSQLGDAEKGFQTQNDFIDGLDKDAETQSPTEKEQILEDEEWLENPAHPRNWPSTKKWINMAIVSRSPPRVLSCFPPCLTSAILGFILYVYTSTHKFNDGAGPATDWSTFSRDQSDDRSDVTQYYTSCLGLFSTHYRPVE